MSAHTLHYTLSLLIDILEYPLFCKRILQGTRILEFFVLRCCRSCHISSHHHLMRFKQKCFPAPLFCYFPSARHNPQFIWLFYICTTPSTVYLVILHLHDTIHSLFGYFTSARHHPQFIWLFYICKTPYTVYLFILHLHDTIHSLFGYFTSARHHPQFIWLFYICTTPPTVYLVILYLHDTFHSLLGYFTSTRRHPQFISSFSC